jgi:hypothetical protein
MISQTDFHDRVNYLENGLSWYMRLRGSDEFGAEVEKAGWQISVCQQEPMELITMCLATKRQLQDRRLESENALRPPHANGEVSSAPRQRRTGARGR